MIGLSLAVGSFLFIGTSFVVKKKSLIRSEQSDTGVSDEDGDTGYLTDWLWWLGLILMTVGELIDLVVPPKCLAWASFLLLLFSSGELANFAAYAFIPATLVAPLGALSVLVTACLASVFLDERLNLVGKLSCLFCLLGSTIVVLHTPKVTFSKLELFNES